jgi:hypothetical protein
MVMRIRRLLRASGLAMAGLAALSAPALAADGPVSGATGELYAFAADHARQSTLPGVSVQEPDPLLCPPNKPDCDREGLDEVVVTGSRIAAGPTITNNQEVGVDEGDIVKAWGDTLVILRRGRLFTVSTAGGGLRAIDHINAYPEGADLGEAWYDEMLIFGDQVVVIGYNYERGGTEISRFRISGAGRLAWIDTNHLVSEDYYSSRNYASRLIGSELVFYSPVEVRGEGVEASLPRLRRWRGEAAEVVDSPLVAATDVYRAPALEKDEPDTLHTVVRCDLESPVLACRGVAIVGPGSRNFYVAPTAVYVWMSERPWDLDKGDEPDAWLYRVPLDTGTPQVARVRGVPIDQFSFQEDPEARRIDIMLVGQSDGEGMWGAEGARGRAALLRLPFDRFGDGTIEADEADYRILPPLEGNWEARNHFVGDYLLYSSTIDREVRDDSEDAWRGRRTVHDGVLTVVSLKDDEVFRFMLPGKIGRIEQMGRDAMVTTNDDDLVFTTVNLSGPRPLISDQFLIPEASESESRSHAFYFRPDPDSVDGSRGVLGLPVFREDPTRTMQAYGYEQPLEVGSVAFMRRGEGRLAGLGGLNASEITGDLDDGCVVSCYGWYGDARPIFLGDRIFALLGYEVIEGRERAGRIREVRRIDMTPPAPAGPRPYYAD